MVQGWPTTKLGEVLELCDAGTWGDESPSGMPLLRSTNMQNGELVLDDLRCIDVPKKQRDRFTLQEGDILVTKSSGSESHIGKCLYISSDIAGKYGFSNFTQRLRANRKIIDPKWIYLILSSPSTRDQLVAASRTTSGLRNLKIPVLKDFDIPLPPIEEQRRIVKKIEKLFEKIDEAAALRQAGAEDSAALLPSALHHIFARAEKEGWEDLLIGNVASAQSGFGFPKHLQGKSSGDIPFFKVSDMNLAGNEIEMTSANNWITEQEAKQRRYRIAPKGTIIFPKIGGAISTNKKRLLSQDSSYDNNVMGLIPKENIVPEYLYWWLQGFDLTEWASDSALPSMKKTTIEEAIIPLPPLTEQKKIVAYLDSLSAKARQLQELQNKTAEDLLALRQSILHRAFSGEGQRSELCPGN